MNSSIIQFIFKMTIFLFMTLSPVRASDVIKVIGDSRYAPFSYEENDEILGYEVDLFNEISKYLDSKYTIELMPWEEAIDSVVSGEGDVLLGVQYHKYLEEKYELTDPIYITDFVIFGKNKIDNKFEISESSVGYIKDSITHKLYIEPLKLKDVREYITYEQAFTALNNNDINYFIGNFSVGKTVLKKIRLNNVRVVSGVIASHAKIWGVKKGNIELKDKINNALHLLKSKQVLSDLDSKWFGDNVDVINLREYIHKYAIELIIFISMLIYIVIISFLFLYLSKKSKMDAFTNSLNIKGFISAIKLKEYDYIYSIEIIDRFNTENAYLSYFTTPSLKKFVERLNEKCCVKLLTRISNAEFVFVTNSSQVDICVDMFELNRFVCIKGISKIQKSETTKKNIMMACYAKDSLRNINNFYSDSAYYDEKMGFRKFNEESMLDKASQAFVDKEFVVYYQPKYDVKSSGITTAEALVRWENKGHFFIFPDQFIPAFERCGLIVKLDLYVLEEVCSFINKNRLSDVIESISVNFSLPTIIDENTYQYVKDILELYGVPPKMLELEITETTFLELTSDILKKIELLRSLGVSIAIDDFGKGASSLSRICNLNADIVKLDRDFIVNCNFKDSNDKNVKLLVHIIAMLKDAGFQIVAEGVEREDEKYFLIKHGCDKLQGYYFSRPICESDFLNYLQYDEPVLLETF